VTLETKNKFIDTHHMNHALGLARRSLGRVWPNPAVGCIIVKNDIIVGRGWTGQGGRPHAETEAIKQAGPRTNGATAYVTLEPCHHQGQTGPCSQALINAQIKRVVVATSDPDPRVSGQGLDDLKKAGIAVECGLLEQLAQDINQGFFNKINKNRPLFSLKTATTLDGRIATKTGHSQWITGPASRSFSHRLRSQYDAILVGRGTVEADQPSLTCRLPGLEKKSPIRVVLDSQLSIEPDQAIIKTASETPTIIITLRSKGDDKARILQNTGVQIMTAKQNTAGSIDINNAAELLANHGLTRVLIEGGGKIAASFMKAGLVDKIYWFRAAKLIGADGLPAIANLGLDQMSDIFSWERLETRALEEDILETYQRPTPKQDHGLKD